MNLNKKEYIDLYNKHEKPASTLYHKYVSKKLAKFFTYYFLKFNITPNMMSLSTFFLTILAGLSLISFNNSFGIILFLLILQFSYVIDCSDGVVARITENSSKFGAFFDVTLDRINTMLVFFSIGLYYHINYGFDTTSIILYVSCSLLFLNYHFMSSLRPFYFPELKGYMKVKDNKTTLPTKILKVIYEFIDTGIFYFILSISLFFKVELYVVGFFGFLGFLLSSAMYIFLYKHKV